MSMSMSSPYLNVMPRSGDGRIKWLQVGKRAAAQRKRATDGLPKLEPISNEQQDSKVLKLPFPLLMGEEVIFVISPESAHGFACRFRTNVIKTRIKQQE